MTRSNFYTTLEDILQVSPGALSDGDSRDTVAQWSSIADVKILSVIASEFGIEPDPQLVEAETIGDMVRLLEARGAFSA